MVSKKRLDCGFNGFQVPTIPRAPRSARRRCPHKKSVDDEQICAFELLASLAGKLLQESESSAYSNASQGNSQPTFGKDVKQEREDENRISKEECLDQGSSEESASLGLTSQNIDRKCIRKEFPRANSNAVLEGTSIITNSDISAKPGGHMKSVICSSRSTLQNYSGELGGVSPGTVVSCYVNVANGIEGKQNSELLETGALTRANTCNSKELTDLHAKYPAMLNGDNNVKFSLFKDPIPNASFSRHRNGIELGRRDDDENFSRCIKPRNKVKASRPPPRVGDQRVRKLLTSKYWKVAPKLRDCEHYRYDGGIKPNYHKRKAFYNWERSQRDNLYKRRKLVDRGSVVTSDGAFSGESVSNSPDKGDRKFPAANRISASVIGHQASFHSKESHVKFRIKSFRVPELFIEVPETETVGSLKTTVMKAVDSILRGGLSVGVLVQGKKVGDDNITLLQTGISSNDNLDSLGFTLEPSPVQASPYFCPADPPPLSCETSVLLTRSPCTPVLNSGMSDVLADPPPPTTNSGSFAESNHESVSSHIDISTNKTMLESQALVAIPEMSMEPLAVVPLNQKGKRPELVQRRTRRPFSVSEVEALVQAVEELGTGRWRDVKLRAFENADHRTYVDLKDKWKTVVHTAQISPQQRRGEPVPQELLDRVLAAHSYWCQHQAKQHSKLQGAIMKITETAADKHGAERYPLV